MKIYSVTSDDNYDEYGIPHDISDSVYYEMSIVDRGENIDSKNLDRKLHLCLVSKGGGGQSDFICGDKWIVVRKGLKAKLEDKLKIFGQWIEVACGDENFYYFRVNNVLDIIDENKSDYQIISPIYKRLVKPVFIDNAGCDSNTFIFYQKKINSKLFVNQEFVEFVAELGLKGLRFSEV